MTSTPAATSRAQRLARREDVDTMNAYWITAAWMGMALLASLISIRVGISVALVEIVVGVIVGNLPGSARRKSLVS